MVSEEAFPAAKLGPLCLKVGSGATPRGGKDSYLESGPYSLIRSQNVHNNSFQRQGLAFISAAQADDLSNVEVQHGDVLLNITGDSVARCCQAPQSVLPARVNQHVAIIRPDSDKLDATFLRYFLVSPGMQEQMMTFASAGATRNALTKGMIEGFDIPKPEIHEQRAIALVLGTLDDKIELNRRMNETLEAMARALFQNWFVDTTQAGLPKGWREGKVSDLATLSRDGLNPGEFPDETFDHYSIPAFDEGRTPKAETGDAIKSNKFVVSSDCVLVSKLNPRIPRIWLPDLPGACRAICSTEFLVATPKPGMSREFLFSLFTSESFASVFATMVTGTSGSHQRVKPESLLGMDAVLPPPSLIQGFTETTGPLLKRIHHNIAESRTLAGLRDALLPKLLSGELRLPAQGFGTASVPAAAD